MPPVGVEGLNRIATDREESERQVKLGTTLALLVVAGIALGAGPGLSPAEARPIVSYCSPTGDFCQGVFLGKRGWRADISTFSFRGKYRLCLRSSAYGRQCRTFRLRHSAHDIYRGSVRLARQFRFGARTRYSVTWYLGGYRVGRTLHFRKR